MMKILTVILSVLTMSANAKELTIINNGSATGINSQLLQEYVKEFPDFDISIRSTNSNCAVSKQLWEKSNTKTLYVLTTNIDGSTDKNNNICYVNINRDNLLFINYSAPMEFCSVGNKSWNDFIKDGSFHTVGITATPTMFPEFILNEIARHYKIKLKLIRSNTNADFMTMVKAGELDFGFRTGLSGLEAFKDKCEWNTAEVISKNMFPFLVNHYDKVASLYEESIFLHKNLSPSDVLEFRQRLHRSWNNDQLKSLRTRRGYNDTFVSYKNEDERMQLFHNFLRKF